MKFRQNAILRDDPLAGVADPEKKSDEAKVLEETGEMTMIQHMHNHRRLTPRQIQLLAIAGTIGAALFVGIGGSLRDGGPLGLVLGYSVWASVIYATALCQAEMVTLLPLDGSFIRLAGRFVDESYGMAAGYNYAFSQAALVCFEINIFNTVIRYWSQSIHEAVFISVLIVLYFLLNIWSVSIFGEVEFYLALGKVGLIFALLFYTIITMLGGNPLGDRYGFRYWREPRLMNEYIGTGDLGRFQGFLACIIGAAFVIAGPEYISMVAGEARNPRKTMPKAFISIIYRLVFFFVIGAVCVGIVCPSDAPNLMGALGPSAANSPYVVSMRRLGITVFPDVVNALILTSILSAGNSYVFGTSRALYSLALAGQAPAFMRRLNRNGVPYVCVIITMCIACLAYLSVSAGTARVLGWWISLVTASQLLNWIFMSTTWIRFNNAMRAQGLDRKTFLPYRSRLQPFAAWYSFIMSFCVLIISGYTLFYPGAFKTDLFIFQYGMIFIVLAIFIGWKVVKRTRFLRGTEVDLHSDLQEIEDYTADYNARQAAKPPKGRARRCFDAIW